MYLSFIRVLFYFSCLCPVKLILFCTAASLKNLSMNIFDTETKVLDTELFL